LVSNLEDEDSMREEETNKLELIIWLIVVVAVIGAFLNIPAHWINEMIEWLVSVFVGSVLSILAGSLVKAFTGDMLKKIFLCVSIKGLDISISFFAIATYIVRLWLFR